MILGMKLLLLLMFIFFYKNLVVVGVVIVVISRWMSDKIFMVVERMLVEEVL